MGSGLVSRLWAWAQKPLIGGADSFDLFMMVLVLMAASVFWTRVLRDVGVE